MKSFKVFSIRLYIDTLIKGHKDKIWFSLKQKVTGRGRPWPPEGGEKMVTEKISPLKAQQRLWYMNVSFQGRLGTQGQRQRRPRITELPTDPTAKAPRNVRAAGMAKYTGKLGKRLLQLQSARQKATKNGLGCLIWPWQLCIPQQ